MNELLSVVNVHIKNERKKKEKSFTGTYNILGIR